MQQVLQSGRFKNLLLKEKSFPCFFGQVRQGFHHIELRERRYFLLQELQVFLFAFHFL